MSEGRYNIPKQYKVDKGMPLDALFQKIDNLKCRRVFEAGVVSVEWSYHLVDKKGIRDMMELVRERGLSIFEVNLKQKISPDLLTDVFAGLLQRPMVMVYLCGGELSMGTFFPTGKGAVGRMCSTDFYPYDADRMIELLDYETDYDKFHTTLSCDCTKSASALMRSRFSRLNSKANDSLSFSLLSLSKAFSIMITRFCWRSVA